MSTSPPYKEAEIENISEFIQASWLHHKRLIVYDIYADIDSDFVVSALYDHIESVVMGWDTQYPFLTLFHHHDILPIWSPLQNERLTKLKQLAKTRLTSGRAAVILPRTPLTIIIQMVLRTIRVSHIEIREFSSPDKAMAWLEEMLI